MIGMKTILTIIIIAAVIVPSFGQADTSKYALTIKQSKYEKTGTKTYLVVHTTLKNNTKDTLRYLSMSCSWREFYHLSNDNLSFEPWVCTKNGPIILILAPNESVDTELKLVVEKTTDTPILKFKIGLNLVEVKNNIQEVYNEYRKKNTQNIIWSNSITLI